MTGWQFQKIIDTSERLGLNKIVSNQVCMYMYMYMVLNMKGMYIILHVRGMYMVLNMRGVGQHEGQHERSY